MGGKYLKRWRDSANPLLTRYTPKPSEVSLVDNPCIPTATFELIKEDGSTELRKFRAAVSLAKIGARNSRADLERLQQLHDTAVALGAACPTSGDAGGEGDPDDNPNDDDDQLARVAAYKNDAIYKLVHRITSLVETQGARIAALEAQPQPGGPILRGARTISKSEDGSSAASSQQGDPIATFRRHLDTLGPQERALALMKFSLANPLRSAPTGRR
jgi:hypothetical protein